MSNNLRTRWLAALRAAPAFAHGRECNYGSREGDADRYDPIGHLAVCYAQMRGDVPFDYLFVPIPSDYGAYVVRHDAIWLAEAAGFPPECLSELCDLADSGVTGKTLVQYVEAA